MGQLINIDLVNDQIQAMGLDRSAVEREARNAARLIEADRGRLKQCDPSSIAMAVADAVSIGVTLNPAAGYAYLEPRSGHAHFRMMYKGLAYLAVKEGAATSFDCQVVHANDEFYAELSNTTSPVTHRVGNFNKRGEVVGVYAVAYLPDGRAIAELIDRKESDAILKTATGPAAKTYPNEYRRKTALKRLCKRLAFGTAESPLARAIAMDNAEHAPMKSEPQPPALPSLTPDNARWGTVIQKLATGEVDLAKVREHFTVSDDDAKKLTDGAVAMNLQQTAE